MRQSSSRNVLRRRQVSVTGVIFDLGYTLVGNFWPPMLRHIARALGGVDQKRLHGVLRREEGALQCGRETENVFWRRVAARLHTPYPGDAVARTLWDKAFSPHARILRGSFGIAKELARRGVPLGVISNTIPEHIRACRRLGLLSPFSARKVILSYAVGMRKPDPRIFRLAAARLGMPVSHILFIDDEPRWVAAARHAGMRSLHFTTPASLRAALLHHGLLKKRRNGTHSPRA